MIGGCLVALAALDIAHFGLDGPSWLAWPAFCLAWGTPWMVGAWWRDRWTRGGFPERRVGITLAVGAGCAASVLVWRAGYQASLIDYGSDGRSNTNPPTLYTAVIGIAQVGVLMIVAPALDRLGRRFRALWDQAGSARDRGVRVASHRALAVRRDRRHSRRLRTAPAEHIVVAAASGVGRRGARIVRGVRRCDRRGAGATARGGATPEGRNDDTDDCPSRTRNRRRRDRRRSDRPRRPGHRSTRALLLRTPRGRLAAARAPEPVSGT